MMDDYQGALLADPLNINDLLTNGASFRINHERMSEAIDDELFLEGGSDDEVDEADYDLSTRQTPWLQSFAELRESMVKIPDWDIYKRITTAGDGDVLADRNCRIQWHYNFFCEFDQEAFDSTYLRGSQMNTTTDDPYILPGMLCALKTMRKGEEAQFVIDHNLMFGLMGCPPRVKPKADILCVVKLINLVETGDENACEAIADDDRRKFPIVVEKAREMFKKSTDLFRHGRFSHAIRVDHKTIENLEICQLGNESEQIEQQEFLIKLYIHLSDCYIKTQDWKKTCSMVNELRRLTNVDKNVKVLLNNGIALGKLGDHDKAIEVLRKAQKIEPHHSELNKELNDVILQRDKYKTDTKNFWKKSFQIADKVDLAKPVAAKEDQSGFHTEFLKRIIGFIENDKVASIPLIGLSNEEIVSIEELLADHKQCKLQKSEDRNGKTTHAIVKILPK